MIFWNIYSYLIHVIALTLNKAFIILLNKITKMKMKVWVKMMYIFDHNKYDNM